MISSEDFTEEQLERYNKLDMEYRKKFVYSPIPWNYVPDEFPVEKLIELIEDSIKENKPINSEWLYREFFKLPETAIDMIFNGVPRNKQ